MADFDQPFDHLLIIVAVDDFNHCDSFPYNCRENSLISVWHRLGRFLDAVVGGGILKGRNMKLKVVENIEDSNL
jgi:hypothetical protein